MILDGNSAVLQRVAWSKLEQSVAHELKNRERSAPFVSAFRWWARRPHSVMGAILDAAIEEYGQGVAVADPFSGGGTVTFEAIRRGVKVYAQDIHAWPSIGLGVAVSHCDPQKLNQATRQLLDALAHLRKTYMTDQGTEICHILRVRSADCADCGKRSFLFASPMLSLESRSLGNKHAFFGCSVCGAVSRRLRDAQSFTCDQCNTRTVANQTLASCAHCSSANLRRTSLWHPVLVQELVVDGNVLRPRLRTVQSGDPVDSLSAGNAHPALAQPIPPGIETRRLLNAGFSCWGDLYSTRQAQMLLEAIQSIKQLRVSRTVKNRLAFAVLGAVEMPAFLSRWDRFHLKAFEAMANHRFAHSNIVVETNLLSPLGRGTIPNRLQAAAIVLDSLVEDSPHYPRVRTQVSTGRVRRTSDWDVLVTTGSSRLQTLPASSVNIVITDPPYYDDVQYGELTHPFHAWMKVYWPQITVDGADEAVPNCHRGTTPQNYEDIIAACLVESRRTLRCGGRLVLTFHNKKLAAWCALAGALRKAGFAVEALAIVLAENATDHCKRSVEAMLHDLVIECLPVTEKKDAFVHLTVVPNTATERNLAAMGYALAEFVRDETIPSLKDLYKHHLASLGERHHMIG